MRLILTGSLMSTLTFFLQPSVFASNTVPFTSSPTTVVSKTTNPATIADFTCSIRDNRVLLNWMIRQNETADRLIIQRSHNGKKFQMVGLVFGTEKTEADHYQFFESIQSRKSFYRIIIVRKDGSVAYSPVVKLNNSGN